MEKLNFTSDYMEGAHPAIMERLLATNLEKTTGYGMDHYTESAKEKIRLACGAPNAAVWFLVGGTQTNALIIDTLLRPWQGVVAADTGHINTHEAGAIERGGHKVMALSQKNGKLSAATVRDCLEGWEQDGNREHVVMPGMVYISQPTEHGTLYTKKELEELSAVCRAHGTPLYCDGARMAYALASRENDVTLKDMAALCDVFYIGGTKCGALFGEAVVASNAALLPAFVSQMK